MNSYRDACHYRHMMAQNAGAGIGFTLAARAVMAARDGNGSAPMDRDLARMIRRRYGDALTATDVLREMACGELAGLRRRVGLTQRAFADRLGITANQLARIERGESGVSEPVLRLARLLQ